MGKLLFGFDPDRSWEYENGYHVTSHPSRLGKVLAHYELYKTILHLPGHVVECGVYKAASLIRFATFRHLLESPWSRKIVAFDAFGAFPPQPDADDQRFIEQFEREGGPGMSVADVEAVLNYKSFPNCELVEGDICETVPRYLAEHPAFKIALLHIDVDVYRPTAVILGHLYDRIVRGGLVVFDDFGIVAGETRAIDEFFLGQDVVIEKLPIAHTPSFVRKR